MGFEWLQRNKKEAPETPASVEQTTQNERDPMLTKIYTDTLTEKGFVIKKETDLTEDIKYRVYLTDKNGEELSEEDTQEAAHAIADAYQNEGITILVTVEDFTSKHIAIEPIDAEHTIH